MLWFIIAMIIILLLIAIFYTIGYDMIKDFI